MWVFCLFGHRGRGPISTFGFVMSDRLLASEWLVLARLTGEVNQLLPSIECIALSLANIFGGTVDPSGKYC